MTAVSPVILQAFQIGWLSHRAALVPVRFASVLAHRPRRVLIFTRAHCSYLRLSREFQHGLLSNTTTRHFSTNPSKSAHQAEHSPSTEEGEAAVAKRDVIDDSSPLTQEELNAIFGQEIDREGAAELLSRLQKQRREGTLDQGLPYPTQMIDRGLEYLRSKYPIDEDAAIVARLDLELDGHWSLPQMYPDKSPTGRSALDEIRKINKAKREKEDAEMRAELEALRVRKLKRENRDAEKAERRLKGERISSMRGPSDHALANKDEAVKSIQGPREHSSRNNLVAFSDANERHMKRVGKWIEMSNKHVAGLRAGATLQKLPQMTRWQRLWRSGLFTFGIVGLGLAIAHFYTPPSVNARLFPEVSPASACVGAIIAVNFLLFAMWRVPYAWKAMNRYFMVVPAVPRAFSMLGAEFSHQKWPHLTANMLAMWFLGTQLHEDIGRGPFLALVLSGAVIPSFCALIPHVMMKIMITASLGASGIVTAFIGTSCVLHEGRKITILGLPPEITSWINTGVLLPLFILVEVINLSRYGLMPKALVKSGQQNIDYLGHLAGYATGIGAGCLIRQTNPYWGGIKRKSFWMPEDTEVDDAKVEDSNAVLLKTAPSLGNQTVTSKS